MKHIIFLEIIRRLGSQGHRLRKLKIFAAVAIVGLVFTLSVLIWAGASATRYIVEKVNAGMMSPQTAAQTENIKAEVQELGVQILDCWGKAQSLMSTELWWGPNALKNLDSLKVTCLDTKTQACEGQECLKTEQIDEGKMI